MFCEIFASMVFYSEQYLIVLCILLLILLELFFLEVGWLGLETVNIFHLDISRRSFTVPPFFSLGYSQLKLILLRLKQNMLIPHFSKVTCAVQ